MEVVRGLRQMQPTFVVRNDGGGANQPDTGLLLLHQHLPTGELFAKRDLSICANDVDAGLGSHGYHNVLLMDDGTNV